MATELGRTSSIVMKNCLSSGNRDCYIVVGDWRGKSFYTVALNKQSIPSSNVHFPS